MRVDEHAHDAGRGVHAAHDAAQARAGAAAGAGAAVDVGQVARGKADERIGLVEGRHHDLAHFAVLERDARIGVADLHIAAVGDMQAGLVEALVADTAHVRRAVALAHDEVVLLFHLGAHLFGKTLAGDEGHFEEKILAQVEALLLGLLGKVHEEARRAHIAADAQLLHHVKLGGGVGRAGGDDRAAQIAQRFLEHEARGRQLIIEGVLHGVAGPEAHGIEGFGIAPVVLGTIFRVKDGAGRKEDALQIPDVLGEQAAQTRAHGLEEDELFFLEDGDMFDVGEGLELLHIELRAVKALLDVFRITVGVGKQFLELNQAVLAALAFVEHFAAAVNAFGAVFAGHGFTLSRFLKSALC